MAKKKKIEYDSRKKRVGSKYNWDALKLEFLKGPWTTATAFRKSKGLPVPEHNTWMQKKMKGWAAEKKEIMEKSLEESTKEMVKKDVKDLIQIRNRQARLARWLQVKGVSSLKDAENLDPEEARKLVVSVLKEERATLGISNKKGGASSLTQVNVNLPKTRFDEMLDGLDYEGVLGLIAELKRERAQRARTKASTEGATEAERAETG